TGPVPGIFRPGGAGSVVSDLYRAIPWGSRGVTDRRSRPATRKVPTSVKSWYYFTAGVALGVAATRRTRRAKEAARAALAAKLTPSAIAADIADSIAEVGNAVGSFASDIR